MSEPTWMPHAGHFALGGYCQFRLNTHVNGYIISTVGEYPREGAEEAGFVEIGDGRLYETMVFPAGKRQSGTCCPYRADDWEELDMVGYNTREDAYRGHMRLLRKWARKGK